MYLCFYPLLGGLIAEVQGGGVPVYGNISIAQRSPVICALYHAASAEPKTFTQMQLVKQIRHQMISVEFDATLNSPFCLIS